MITGNGSSLVSIPTVINESNNMNEIIILIIMNILLLTVCGLLWYRGLIYRKRLRYWRNQAVKTNARIMKVYRNNFNAEFGRVVR